MNTIALFSDVHGNLPALETVLADIRNRNINQLYCLGDLIDFAPWHNEVIRTIRDLGIPCLMGNHDERIAFNLAITPLLKHNPTEAAARNAAIEYSKQSIAPDCKEYLSQLPEQLRLTISQSGKEIDILLVHGSIRSNNEYIYEEHDIDDIRKMLDDSQADMVVMGHTHKSYIRTIPATADSKGGMAINCGSVGRSREGQPLASYLILEIDEEGIRSEIIQIPYPVTAVIEAIRKSPIPDFYAKFLMQTI